MTAAVGDTVVLPCRTALIGVSVDWRYRKTEDSHEIYVYSNFVVYEIYVDKVSGEAVRPALGDYSLTLSDAQVNDTGWYMCIEDGGLGGKHAVVLIVSGRQKHS